MFGNHPSPPQMSQFPGLKSSIAWTVQRSPGYMSNDGTVTVGETTWVIEQQIKSFATFEDQELLLKLKVAIPLEAQEHYFLFHHKVTWQIMMKDSTMTFFFSGGPGQQLQQAGNQADTRFLVRSVCRARKRRPPLQVHGLGRTQLPWPKPHNRIGYNPGIKTIRFTVLIFEE